MTDLREKAQALVARWRESGDKFEARALQIAGRASRDRFYKLADFERAHAAELEAALSSPAQTDLAGRPQGQGYDANDPYLQGLPIRTMVSSPAPASPAAPTEPSDDWFHVKKGTKAAFCCYPSNPCAEHALTPVQEAAVKEYTRVMNEEVIPQVIEVLVQRQRAWKELRSGFLPELLANLEAGAAAPSDEQLALELNEYAEKYYAGHHTGRPQPDVRDYVARIRSLFAPEVKP